MAGHISKNFMATSNQIWPHLPYMATVGNTGLTGHDVIVSGVGFQKIPNKTNLKKLRIGTTAFHTKLLVKLAENCPALESSVPNCGHIWQMWPYLI